MSAMVTSLTAIGALVFTAVSLQETRTQIAGQVRSADIAEQGQITDRYTAAINQLGSGTLDVRIGGIYALERIMRDSAADQPTTVEVLSAFIRDHLPDYPRPQTPYDPMSGPVSSRALPTDVQAAFDVLGRRDPTRDAASHVNLSGVNLVAADLTDVNLSGAVLDGADLQDAYIGGVGGKGSGWVGPDLAGALNAYGDLHGADLQGADLGGANLYGADLSEANLSNADLRGANAEHANLTNTDLFAADLTDVDLIYGNLSGARLDYAACKGMDTTYARVTTAQVSQCRQ